VASTTIALPSSVLFSRVHAQKYSSRPSVSAGYASGVAKTVTPANPTGLANAAGGGANVTVPSSGAIAHAALPAGSLLSIVALLLTVVHI
jgi:hypothetical protein